MSETKELAKIENGAPKALVRQATDIAGLCREIVEQTAQSIQGRRYVRVEGWQAIATAHGCVASARDVERVDGGIRAIGEVRRIDTGSTISQAEGFVGDDESMWAKRPEYARRAMAQTRAISRACRSAFAHVVVMMNAGLETTPAEEVPVEGFVEHKPVKPAAPAEPRNVEICQWKKSKAFGKRWDSLPDTEVESAYEFAEKKNFRDLADYLSSILVKRREPKITKATDAEVITDTDESPYDDAAAEAAFELTK